MGSRGHRVIGRRQSDILDKSAAHRRVKNSDLQPFTLTYLSMDNLEFPINVRLMLIDVERKLEKTFADTPHCKIYKIFILMSAVTLAHRLLPTL